MADLENLLLEAAGRTGLAGRNCHSRTQASRRRREGSYSDDGSDSKDDDSDRGGYAKRKPSWSQVPLKKRLETTENQGSPREGDDGSDRNGDSGDDSFGSDLYKEVADREKLARLSELDREMELANRAQKIDDLKLQKQLRQQRGSVKKPQSSKKAPPATSSRGISLSNQVVSC